MKTSQKDRIINYIRKFGSITDLEASRDLGIQQFGARIFNLKEDGYKFRTEWETSKNRFGEKVEYKRYYLADITAENMQHISQI